MSTDNPTAAALRRGAHQRPPRGRWRKRAWLVIGLLAVGAFAAQVVTKESSSAENGPRFTHRVRRGDLIVTVTEQGTLESAVNTEIKCRVRDKEIPITWVIAGGSKVKPGDVLVRLATLAYEDRINEVSKRVHSARSTAERSRADRARAALAVP